MNDKQIYAYFGEAVNYADPNAFASDVALSLLDADDPGQDVDIEVFEQLRIMWHIYNDPFRDFLRVLGLNQTQCSTRFCIPLRTVQGWALGERTPPPYVRLMMAEAVGLLKIR